MTLPRLPSEVIPYTEPSKNYLTDATLYAPTPLLKLWHDWHMATAHRPQPFLACLAGIATFGVIMGNRYRGHTGCKPNPYIIGLAGTGMGKGNVREMGQFLLQAIGRENSLGADVWGSDGGVEGELMSCSETLWFIDEFNETIRDWKKPNCPSYKTHVKRLLLQVHNGGTYNGKSLKDPEERNKLKDPCPVIMATAQPGPFFDLIDKNMAEEGFLNRCYIYDAHHQYHLEYGRKRKFVGEGMPVELLKAVKDAMKAEGNSATKFAGISMPIIKCKIDAVGEEVERVLHDYAESKRIEADDKKDSLRADLYPRTMEKIARLALIHAWTKDWMHTVISADSILWAARMTRLAESTLIDRCHLIRTQDDRYEKAYAQVYATIERFASTGISQSELAARHHLPKTMFEGILSMMLASEKIRQEPGKSGKGRRFFPLDTQAESA